jgi:nicotinate-nucleotide adenylyltransferase
MKNLHRIGIFGGTFNPIDNAHIAIAKQFIQELNIGICYIIPANISPFKTEDNEVIYINPQHRIQMLNLAFSNDSCFIPDTYEIDKGGVSYSYDTIQYLKSKHPNSEIFLLIGSDQAVSFKEWKEWEWILNNTQLCIAMREGFSEPEELMDMLKIGIKSPIILNSPLIKISATDIRLKLKIGESVIEYVPREVEEYIKSNKLYIS